MKKKQPQSTNPNDPHVVAKLRASLFRLLAKRDYSHHMLVEKLSKRGYDTAAILTLLDECKTRGYLDDARFAAQYLSYRRQRGIGPKRIALELKIRGIDESIIAEHIKIADNDWLIEMQMLLTKRLKHHTMQRPEQRAKLMRYFLSRGYTHEQIAALFNHHQHTL